MAKGEQDCAELGANTDANHTCTYLKENYIRTICFFFIRSYLLLHKLKKEDDLTSASGLRMSKLDEPNQMILAILID